MPSRLSTFSASRTRERPFKLMRRPATSASPMPMDATPRPPICIKIAMTACPNRLNVSPVSTTTSPVTDSARFGKQRVQRADVCAGVYGKRQHQQRRAQQNQQCKAHGNDACRGLIFSKIWQWHCVWRCVAAAWPPSDKQIR